MSETSPTLSRMKKNHGCLACRLPRWHRRQARSGYFIEAMNAVLILLLLTGTAMARDPTGKYANSPLAHWYKDQHNSIGQWCCDESDAHPYFGDYAVNSDGSVTVDGENIPKEKVLSGPNPTGAAVWWFLESGGNKQTYCFAIGSGV